MSITTVAIANAMIVCMKPGVRNSIPSDERPRRASSCACSASTVSFSRSAASARASASSASRSRSPSAAQRSA